MRSPGSPIRDRRALLWWLSSAAFLRLPPRHRGTEPATNLDSTNYIRTTPSFSFWGNYNGGKTPSKRVLFPLKIRSSRCLGASVASTDAEVFPPVEESPAISTRQLPDLYPSFSELGDVLRGGDTFVR